MSQDDKRCLQCGALPSAIMGICRRDGCPHFAPSAVLEPVLCDSATAVCSICQEPVERHRDIEAVRSSEQHKWDRDGERCLNCGAKDWMEGPCTPLPPMPSELLLLAKDSLMGPALVEWGRRIIAARSASRSHIPDVLFDSYAVYKELLSPEASGISISAQAVAEVLDAAVRLLRRAEGGTS